MPSKCNLQYIRWNLWGVGCEYWTRFWDIAANDLWREACRFGGNMCPGSTRLASDSSCWKTRRPWFGHGGRAKSGFSTCWSCRWSVPGRLDTIFVYPGIARTIHRKLPCHAFPAYQWAARSDTQITSQKCRSWNFCHCRLDPEWSVIYINPNYTRS